MRRAFYFGNSSQCRLKINYVPDTQFMDTYDNRNSGTENHSSSPAYPRRSNPEEIQGILVKLSSLRETRQSPGVIHEVSTYLQWIFGKAYFYESDVVAQQVVIGGGLARSIDEYVDKKKHEVAAYEQAAKEAAVSYEQTAKEKAVSYYRQAKTKAEELNATSVNLEAHIIALQSQLHTVNEQVELAANGYYDYDNPAEQSVKFKGDLDKIKALSKRMITENAAILSANSGFTFNNSKKEGDQFVKDFAKLMLSSYNQEVENAIVKMSSTRDINTAISRVEKAAEKVEKLGTMMSMSINPRYAALRIREIEIGFAYKEAREAAKEKEKAERDEIREQEKAAKEAAARIKEVEREEKAARDALAALLNKQQSHYTNVSNALSVSLPADDPEIIRLQEKIAEIEEAKEKANAALHNPKAGYVYVISNIGSFGEGVVKIGLTRRLNPQDRVTELSDASVPFIFDTHAIHFSDDAVALETSLHKHFADRAMNKVNFRKEFFRVSPLEVRDALIQLSKDGSTLEFNEDPIAAEYYRTRELEK